MALSVRDSIAELSEVGLTDDLALLLADPEPQSPSVGSLGSSKKPSKSASPEKKQTVSSILNKFDKKWKKSTHSVLSSRYDAAPHKPPILLKRELSRLSDPIAGKFKNWKEYDDKINGKGRDDDDYGNSSMGGAFLTGLIEDDRSVGSVGSKQGSVKNNQSTTFLTSDEQRDEDEGSLGGLEKHIKYGKFDKPEERVAAGRKGVRGGTVSRLRGKLEEAARMNYKRSRGLQSSVLDQSYDSSIQPGPKGRFGRREEPPQSNNGRPVRGRQTNNRGKNAMNTSRDYGRSSGYGVNGTKRGSRSVSRTRKSAASKTTTATFDMNGRRIKNPAKDGTTTSSAMGNRSMRSRVSTLNSATNNKTAPSTSTRGGSVRSSGRDPLKNISSTSNRATRTNNANNNNSRSRYGMRKSKSDALNTSTNSNTSIGSAGNKENSRNLLRSKSATMRSSAHNGAGGALSAIRERKAIRKNSRSGIPNNNNNNNNNAASASGFGSSSGSRSRATGSAPSHLSSSRTRGRISGSTANNATSDEPRPSAPEKKSVSTKGKVIASTGAGSSRPSSRITREFAGKDKENIRHENSAISEGGGRGVTTGGYTKTTTATPSTVRGNQSVKRASANGTNNSYRPTVDVLKALASVQQSENERIMRKNGIPIPPTTVDESNTTSSSVVSTSTKVVSKALSKGPGGKMGSKKDSDDKSYAAILAAKANKLKSHIDQAESLTKKIVAVDEAETMAMNLETTGIPPPDIKIHSDIKESSDDTPVVITDVTTGGAPAKKAMDTSVRLKSLTAMPSESKLDELQQSMDEQRLKELLEADKNMDGLDGLE